MNLRDLEYLVAIDEQKHFGRAAEACHVSQPTLSGQLKKLEAHLGVQLVERNNRQVFTTEVGAEVARRARGMLRDARDIEHLAQTYANPMSGTLRLGLIPTVAPYLLPLFVNEVKLRWNSLELTLHEGRTADMIEMLRNGRLDALVQALGVPGTEGFEELHLYDEPFLLAVPKDHPLSEQKTVQESDLKGRRLLLLEQGHCMRGQALDVCSLNGAGELEDFRATSLETLRHMVAAGAGITLIPQLAVPKHGSPGICYLPFVEPAPRRELALLYRGNTGRLMSFRNLAKVIREQVAKHRT